MAVKTSNQVHDPTPAFLQTVEEIMKLYRSLPARPSFEEVEAANSVIKSADSEERSKLEEISALECPQGVPEELFTLLKQARKTMVLFQSHGQKKDAIHLVDADQLFETFDGLIQRASLLISGDTQNDKIGKSSVVIVEESLVKEVGRVEKDGSNGLMSSSSRKAGYFPGEVDSEKLSLMKVASIIENSAKTESQ